MAVGIAFRLMGELEELADIAAVFRATSYQVAVQKSATSSAGSATWHNQNLTELDMYEGKKT